MHSRDAAKSPENTYHAPIQVSKPDNIMEAVVHCRYSSSPHQEHDAEIVKLIAEVCYASAVVIDDMERRR